MEWTSGYQYPTTLWSYPHQIGFQPYFRGERATAVPHANGSSTCRTITTPEVPPQQYAIIYSDEYRQIQMETSPSVADTARAIFTPDVIARFRELIHRSGRPNIRLPNTNGAVSSGDMPMSAGWMSASQPGVPEPIPFEWQSPNLQQKCRNRRRASIIMAQPQSTSPILTPEEKGSLYIKDHEGLKEYYMKSFEAFQQLNCRVIAKAYVKLIEPKKQVNFPYNGRTQTAGGARYMDPERTKPVWWPADVPHREPDHLLKRGMVALVSYPSPTLTKPDRLRLLVHILCELKDSHGITAEKLREASQDYRRDISPTDKLQILDEIYSVRKMEERYLDRHTDSDTFVSGTLTRRQLI